MVEDLEGEVWKDIPEYEGLYQISNYKRVKSLAKGGLILKPYRGGIKLFKQGKYKSFTISHLYDFILGDNPNKDLVNEKWLPVPGYLGQYEVSNKGRLKSLYRPRILKQQKMVKGYPYLIIRLR